MEALRMKNISKTFPGVKALNRVNFDVKVGEIHGLVGENGAGKSTLMNILFGIFFPNGGSIELKSEEVELRNPYHSQAMGISMIHQEPALAPNMTVKENICLCQIPKRLKILVDKKKMWKRAQELLAKLASDINPDSVVEDLTISQKQIVSIAKALFMNSKIVIMDEANASLTPHETKRLFKVMRELKKDGISFIFISHRMEDIFEITDRITVLRNGEYIGTVETKDTTTDKIILMMTGKKLHDILIKEVSAEETTHEREIIFEADNITSPPHFYNVSFKVYKGEIVGLTGLVGAGRSEVAEAIFGTRPIKEGVLRYLNERYIPHSTKKVLQHGIGFLPEDRHTQSLFADMSVGDNILIAHFGQLGTLSLRNKKKEKGIASDWINKLKIKTPSMNQIMKNLSGGNQQKVLLSRLLELDPMFLVLDEPTHGIDVGTKAEIHELITELARRGTSVLLISSEFQEIIAVCDRIYVMSHGKITNQSPGHGKTNAETLLHYATI